MSELKYRYYVTTLVSIAITILFGWLLSLWNPKDSAEVASWVQAIGSILAIVGAIYVGRSQANESLRQAHLMRDLDRKGRQDAIFAVVQAVYIRCITVRAHAKAGNSVTNLREYWAREGEADFSAALTTLLSLPLYELKSANLVLDIHGIQGPMTKIQSALDRIDRHWDSLTIADQREIMKTIRTQVTLAETSWLMFVDHRKEAA